MSYNKKDRAQSLPNLSLSTAGKVTIFTTVSGLAVFLLVFLLNLGQTEIKNVEAQSTATTSVNVLNTPPEFLLAADEPQEETESSTSSPTNSGDEIAFVGTATDQNGAPYFLIVCSTNAATAQAGDGSGSTAPICTNNDLIAISTSTNSGTEARAATTTLESMPELNDWYAFACDDDPINPECSAGFQGTTTTASPFVVNHRPTFTVINNDGPVDPGALLSFTTTADDADTEGGDDTIQLVVCNANDYDTSTNACGVGGTLATSTFSLTNPTAAVTIPTPRQDDDYDAFVFVVDNHGHEAQGGQQAANNQYTVANVAPTISGAQITLNGGNNIVLDTAAGETTGLTLEFVVNDANSCQNAAAGPEVVDYTASVFRSGIGTTSCDALGEYNPNNCYTSTVASTTWNISCNATTTGAGACGGSSDPTVTWECSFPVWYVADPTDPAAVTPVFEAEDWRAAVAATDDDAATSSFEQSTAANIEVVSFLSFVLDTAEIPYGSLAPGDSVSGSTTINTTVRPTGNVGIDTDLSGVRMCPDTFAVGTCPVTATSSIAETQQEYGTTTFAYGTGVDLTTTDTELELNVQKATSTVTQPSGITYWALEVPGTITLAGLYTGRNTITAVTSESAEW